MSRTADASSNERNNTNKRSALDRILSLPLSSEPNTHLSAIAAEEQADSASEVEHYPGSTSQHTPLSNMKAFGNQRQGSYLYSKPLVYPGMGQHHNPAAMLPNAAMYLPNDANNANNINALAQGFGGINLQYSRAPSVGSGYGAAPAAVWNGNGVMYTGQHGMPHLHNGPHSPGFFFPQGDHGYSAHSPLSSAWTSRVPSSEMPTLITTRRDSTSSNEIDAPGTPFNAPGVDFHGGISVMDRSPHGSFVYGTPSPPQFGQSWAVQKAPSPSQIPLALQILVQQEPPIPRAVPAPHSPVKPLDKSLENRTGETNVYIRGLLPQTTDEMLQGWATRFGEIKSSKSIIDHNTGLCKGYGFVKYHNFADAENCIRGFHHLGYEVSFARESFYSQLKKLTDEANTNLYISNLPKDMNEHELGAIFGFYKVCSSKILRDSAGNGRGVGFARFESKDVCEEVIKSYHNTPVRKTGGEEHLIQIRFSDTQDQKNLKQQTTAARQFRTAEYEYATQGAVWSRFNVPRMHGAPTGTPVNDFESYLAHSTRQASVGYVPTRVPSGPQYGTHLLPTATPPQGPYAPAIHNITPPTAVKYEPVGGPEAVNGTSASKKSAAIAIVFSEQK